MFRDESQQARQGTRKQQRRRQNADCLESRRNGRNESYVAEVPITGKWNRV